MELVSTANGEFAFRVLIDATKLYSLNTVLAKWTNLKDFVKIICTVLMVTALEAVNQNNLSKVVMAANCNMAWFSRLAGHYKMNVHPWSCYSHWLL